MITRVHFWPHPPALFTELTGAAADDLAALRAALGDAAGELADADVVVVLGTGPEPGVAAPSTVGSLAGFGADVEVSFPRLADASQSAAVGAGAVEAAALAAVEGNAATGLPPLERLPLSLLVAARVLSDGNPAVPCAAVSVGEDGEQIRRITREVVRAAAESPDRVALVVMGDGSAGRASNSPGYLIDGAIDYDDAVLAALGSGSFHALADLDAETGRRVMAAGAEIWPALGQALSDQEESHAEAAASPDDGDGKARSSLHSQLVAADPFVDDSLGVLYVVGRWARR